MLEFDSVDWSDQPPQLVARCRLRADLASFRGHFPSRPLLPAVSQLLIVQDLAARRWGPIVAASRFKFIAPLVPGDTLTVRITPRAASRLDVEIIKQENVATKGTLTVAEP
ncbi:MAG: hypothetical protein KDJ27_19445 [Gammaproteobacteria bacterium]|nr:hypothetical protein [Gammaproteobacteria bacterium]